MKQLPASNADQVRMTVIVSAAVLLVAAAIIAWNRSYLFHTESEVWKSKAIGDGATMGDAQRMFDRSWAAEGAFLNKHGLVSRNVKMRPVNQSTETDDTGGRVIGYRIEREVDVYGSNDAQLVRYSRELSDRSNSDTLVGSSLPQSILTFADYLFVFTIALGVLCAGALWPTRDPFGNPPGMSVFSIVCHMTLIASAAMVLWSLADQPTSNHLGDLIIGVGSALLVARWAVVTRAAWKSINMSAASYGWTAATGLILIETAVALAKS